MVEPEVEGEERPVVVTIDNRFKRARGDEVCVTAAEEQVEVRKFLTRPAVVRRGYGVTLNLGNFESARIDVTVEVPCYLLDIERASKWAEKFVGEKMAEEVASVRGEQKEEKPKDSSHY